MNICKLKSNMNICEVPRNIPNVKLIYVEI